MRPLYSASYIDAFDGFVNMGRVMDGNFFVDFHLVFFQFIEKMHGNLLQDLAGLSFLLTRIIVRTEL